MEQLTIADQAKRGANWVDAHPNRQTDIVPLHPGQIVATDGQTHPALWEAPGGGDEYATPVTRATGQIIRLIPFSVVWLVLSVGLVMLTGWAWPWLFVSFASLTAVTFAVMNRQEFDYSRNGLERHRVDKAAALRALELRQQHELRRAALQTYLEIARNHYGVGDHD